MLPDGWDLCRLEDLATVERGKFSARPRNDPKFFGGNIPFVQTGDVTNSSIYVRNYSQTLNEEGLSVSKMFPKGTILMTIAANIGDTAIASFDLACPDSLVGIIAKKNKADVYWLRIFLGTQKTTLENYAPQNAQKNINLQTLKPLEILTPPLPEQKKIAAILSTWDRAIEGTEKLLANSQQQKKALMQQLLTGKKRLPGFTGEWETKFLGDIADIQTGSSNRQDSLTNGEYTFFDRSEDIRTSNRYLFDCEAVIVPGEGQDFVPKYFVGKFDLHQRTYAISYFRACDGKFIFYTVGYHRSHFLSQAVGSTVKSLRLPMFQKMPLKLPPLPEQQAIAAVLTTADEELAAIESDLSRLRQEKKALMQQLLTGKIRVAV